jgi:uncharacterized protein (DUF488 family)
MAIFTVGHSTRSIDELVDLLREHDVGTLVDIRTVPRSRFNPQFNADSLPRELEGRNVAYVGFPDLGGLRKARKDSPNSGWRNASFRGYADYMGTESFRAALDRLIDLAGTSTLALMCAEAVPWRCHRSLVGDALSIRGIEVFDILGPGNSRPHRVTPFAHVEAGIITYPPDTDDSERVSVQDV